ncbi:sialic acid-binding Ig-like lectin 7 isoform X1 [Micropterus salmoides]|uniref:sialic acid-binding Ig-like lectin 7 isoform X1 n=2 Tax=Micropterus salmoides TaxID=27706 RepID=UPI0018EDFF5B|nr:sialic acid-binding Ig-like lectin 7 isoform X1 [Micropterus salmoides]
MCCASAQTCKLKDFLFKNHPSKISLLRSPLMWACLTMGYMAVLSVNMVTANMLLSVFFISGALAQCPNQPPAIIITAPQKMEALSGSCLQIPCNFSVKKGDFTGMSIFGVWIKQNNNLYPTNITIDKNDPMNIIGNLCQKNCTTLVSNSLTNLTNTYFLRIQNFAISGSKATACNDPLQVNVTDSPPSPKIEIPADLKEKQSVTITCSASTPCPHSPPKLTWNLQQDSHSNTEENTDRTFTTKIQETITLSDQHDGYNITCSARYPVNEGKDVKTAEERKTLSVSYAPKNTSVSISPSGLVSAGSWVNLTCSSRAKPPVSRFTWFKSSTDGPKTVSEGEVYSFKVTNVTDEGVYYCVATNDLGNQTSEFHLTLEGSLNWGAVLGGILGVILLVCLVVSVCAVLCGRRLKSTHSTQQLSQSHTREELAVENPAFKTEEKEEDIQYGEIDFSNQRPEPSSDSAQDSGQQQDTLYAQVKVSQPANSLTQTADGPEDLYAQVKKK